LSGCWRPDLAVENVHSARPSGTIRQACGYMALCAATGAILPFMPLWLRQNGMTALQIGWILAIPLLGRAVTGPLIGLWADRFGRYRSPIAILACLATLSYAALLVAPVPEPYRLAAFLLLYGTGYTALTNIPPLLDAMTLQLSHRNASNFGVSRALGSAAFALTNIALGYMIPLAGTGAVMIWVVVASGLTWMSAWFLMTPQPRFDVAAKAGEGRRSAGKRFAQLAAVPGYLVLLAALGCLQAAHGYYYAFSTIIWQRQGLSAAACGMLWGIGVAAELLFLSLRSRFRRLDPWTLLLLGAAAGVLRWATMGLALPTVVLWPLQLLHGLSFTAVYVAGLELIHLIAPRGSERLGQAISSAYAGGALIGLVTLASAPLLNPFAARGYLAMAVLSLVGLGGTAWLYVRRARIPGLASEA